MTVLLCPLCSQPRFSNLESLRLSLINAATQSISCPICNDVLMGLDKLTIHLFGHTLNQNVENCRIENCLQLKTSKTEDAEDYPEKIPPSTLNGQESNFDVNDVVPEKPEEKIEDRQYFKDVENCYVLGVTKSEEAAVKDSSLCTVNMEDLTFLTSWENGVRTKEPENLKDWGIENEENSCEKEVKFKEDNTELSEYMSDLLNKKLPISNFVFSIDVDKTTNPDEKKQLKCSTCGYNVQNPIVLSMHQELVHSKKTSSELIDFVTDFGDKAEETEDGIAEFVTRPVSENGCRNRTVAFVAEEKAEAAVESGETNGDDHVQTYDCRLCRKIFKMKAGLLVHLRTNHYGFSDTLQTNFSNPESPEERNFHCSICSKSFKKEQHLTQHLKTHEGKQWQCETCSKHFTTKYFLKKHQRLHTGEMPYSCPACKKTFTFQQSYHKHLLYHSDEKPHQCTQCGRSFKELSTLHNHQRIHSGEKPFACETCGKCFRQRVSYIVHQRIHTGVLPYQCTACKKKFRYKVSQRSHKCTAQPPGIVIRQPGDLIQRILEHRNDFLQITE